ncbi:hypothetical protein QMG90_04230 [Trabulsiella odontotermitis]|uniref:hypothetical protein n=1 Tax=Trabulsiella odontotermitis TaxID=379893 RepID=UPI0024B7ECF2|nr:hypothetical protein [Trabulsiella odontotermitis]WHP32158.1 hypothetical protein QMG90_04230 [Trabulsiella odontotermitis]
MNDDMHKVSVTSRHELLYFFGYIKRNNIVIRGIPKVNDDCHKWSEKINQAIEIHYREDQVRIARFIKKMLDDFDDDKLLIDDIEFIRDNKITCMFTWLYIRQCETREQYFLNEVKKRPIYKDMNLPTQSKNHGERCDDILDYFRHGYLSGKTKLSIIDIIQDAYNKTINEIKPLYWLDEKNDEQCEWACDYILQRYKPDSIDIDKPTDTQERYLLAYGLLFLMIEIESESEWKLFLTNINRAWSQKKHRGNKKEQLPLNTYLDKKTKEKLKVLCVNKGVSIQTMLSHLINTEYNKTKG